MLVYGDRSREVAPRDVLDEVRDLLAAGCADEALIEVGALAQGLADDEFRTLGFDDVTPLQDAVVALTLAVARASCGGEAACARLAIARLSDTPLPSRVRCRTPEGFAFYAVYPQAYAEAARAHPWTGRPLVLGLRSIGLTLGAVVAAATGGDLLTLRPTGDPFRRTLRLSPALRARIAAWQGPISVVDEGPGLSGSSFGSVGDLLDELGVAPERVVYMPSHHGAPGPQAAQRHLGRWASSRRLVRTLDDLLAERPMGGWFEEAIGPALACDDLSGGAWRTCGGPPVDAMRERRKFRIRTAQGVFVARFAGLDRSGREKFERAKVLHAAGFGAEPVAFHRGFLLERWVEGRRLDPKGDRVGLLPWLAAYLRLRQERFPAPTSAGATAAQLVEMGRVNAETLCGADVARRLEWPLAALGGAPVHVDGRLHAWEWRVAPQGFRKLDALDHSCAHDLVGAQGIAWDVAGAAVELGLNDAASRELARRCGADAAALRTYEQAYAAFQGGLWSLAEDSAAPAEARRIRLWRRRYARHLERLATG